VKKPAVIRDLSLDVFGGVTAATDLVELELAETFEKLWLQDHVDATPLVFHVMHVSGPSPDQGARDDGPLMARQ
jgi:hypothetical protein